MQRIASAVVLIFTVLGAACTTAKEVYTPDGRRGLAIRCSGTANSWGSCLERVANFCKSAGYDVFMRDNTTGQTSMVTSAPQTGLQGFSGSTINRELLIACKALKPRLAAFRPARPLMARQYRYSALATRPPV